MASQIEYSVTHGISTSVNQSASGTERVRSDGRHPAALLAAEKHGQQSSACRNPRKRRGMHLLPSSPCHCERSMLEGVVHSVLLCDVSSVVAGRCFYSTC